VAPTASYVDFRAACFCHRRVVDLGFVCSVCLASRYLSAIPATMRSKYTWSADITIQYSARRLKELFVRYVVLIYVLRTIGENPSWWLEKRKGGKMGPMERQEKQHKGIVVNGIHIYRRHHRSLGSQVLALAHFE